MAAASPNSGAQTPFPSCELFRQLPSREALLHGVLAGDVVGFHIFDYAQNFRSCCAQLLGLESTPVGVK